MPLKLPEVSRTDQRILDSVPQTIQRKAKLILSILRNHSNALSWDEDGTVNVYGKPIRGSNITDLVNDVLRHRKGSEPTGWWFFAEALREINVPKYVVGNRESGTECISLRNKKNLTTIMWLQNGNGFGRKTEMGLDDSKKRKSYSGDNQKSKRGLLSQRKLREAGQLEKLLRRSNSKMSENGWENSRFWTT